MWLMTLMADKRKLPCRKCFNGCSFWELLQQFRLTSDCISDHSISGRRWQSSAEFVECSGDIIYLHLFLNFIHNYFSSLPHGRLFGYQIVVFSCAFPTTRDRVAGRTLVTRAKTKAYYVTFFVSSMCPMVTVTSCAILWCKTPRPVDITSVATEQFSGRFASTFL